MSERNERIAALNDELRRTFEGGRVMQTRGVTALGPELVARVHAKVRTFAAFTPDNDPYGQHDFGSFGIAGVRVMWKIDHYDPSLSGGSEDPADPGKTTRVLTILLAEEY